jgi:type IX secretion system PorP/SprF family membrane protein
MKKIYAKGKKLIFTTSLSISALLVQSQDFHFSQYDAAALNLNPSNTGLFDGWYRIHGQYRTQWSSLVNNPFQTFLVSGDVALKNFSIGGQIMDYRAGTGNYNVFGFLASAAYDFSVDKQDNHHFSVGAQLGIIQKSVNVNKLTWGTQYSNNNGGGFDNTLPSGEVFGTNSILMPDVNIGFTYYYGKEQSRVNPFIGYTIQHLNYPKESFYSQNNRLPLKHTVNLGCKIYINKTIQLLPKILIMRQRNAKETSMGLIAHYYLKESDAYLIFGPTFRLSGPLAKSKPGTLEKDAALIEAGLKYGKFEYRISYDINTSTLRPYSSGRGAFELSVTYIARRKKPAPIINCPRL